MQITLKAARINVDFSQQYIVDILKEKYSVLLTRQRLADFERDSSNIPIKLADILEDIYFLSRDDIYLATRQL